LEVVDNICGVGAIFKLPIVISTKVAQANAKMLSVSEALQSLSFLYCLNLGQPTSSRPAGFSSFVISKLFKSCHARSIRVHAITHRTMICRGGWSELLSMTKLVATHVIEVLVCIVLVDKLLSAIDDNVSLFC
jgi:hypothetical protein